jgi:hypothetical protein
LSRRKRARETVKQASRSVFQAPREEVVKALLRASEDHNRPPDRPLRSLALTEIPVRDRERMTWAEMGMVHVRTFRLGECGVILSIYGGKWHLSISHPSRLPTWAEVVEARYRLMPDSICAAMLLPSKEEYVNLHEFCFHLHEVEDSGDDRR